MENPKVSIITVGMNHLNYIKELISLFMLILCPTYLLKLSMWTIAHRMEA